MPLTDLGHIIEGVVERDPLDECLRIRTVDQNGKQILIDPIKLLSSFEGKEIKMTLASLESLKQIQEALEASGYSVEGVMPEDLDGVSVNITKKP